MFKSGKSEIEIANKKILTLRAHLGDPVEYVPKVFPNYSDQEQLADLQQLAISSRSVLDRAKQLHNLIFFSGIQEPPELQAINESNLMHPIPVTCGGAPVNASELFEYTPQLRAPYKDDFAHIFCGYQSVTGYAEQLRQFVTFWLGGWVASILPVCYALLGASAWSLRQMQIKLREKTFHSADMKSAHYLVAAIAGTVISLFNGLFVSSGLSLSPLAWAFLAGYSSDVMLRVLDGVMRPHVRDEVQLSK